MKAVCPGCGKSAPVFKVLCRCCGKRAEILRCSRCGEYGRSSGPAKGKPPAKPSLSEKEIIKWEQEFYSDPENQKEYLKVVKEHQDFLEAADKRYAETARLPGKQK